MIVAAVAGFVPINVLGEMTSIGTLFAFVVVSLAVIVLRIKRPEARRPFRVPGGHVIPILGVLSCVYLMVSLSVMTWVRFLGWLDIGMIIYWFYGRTHSPLVNQAEAAARSGIGEPGELPEDARLHAALQRVLHHAAGVPDDSERHQRDAREMERARRGPVAHRRAHQSGDCRCARLENPHRGCRGDRGSGTCSQGRRASDSALAIAEGRGGRAIQTVRLSPWWAGWRLSVVLLATIICVGTTGYVVIEGWDVFDAFYMTITTVTTVGYGEIHPLSRAGRVFNSGVIVLGVATVLYTFSFLMARLVEGDLQARWARRRRERMLDDLTHHFIICGFGRIGQIVAREFSRQSVPLVIIERDAERMQAAIDAGYLAVEADASSEEVLKRVGIMRARGFIAAVSTDADNVFAILTARLLRPDLFIIGRAETEDAKAKLVRAGADRVLSPYQIGGLQLAQTALRPAVVDFVQLATSSDNLDLNMEQVQIGAGAAAGRTFDHRGQSPPALRRGGRRHPASDRRRWNSTRRPRRSWVSGTTSWSWGRRKTCAISRRPPVMRPCHDRA